MTDFINSNNVDNILTISNDLFTKERLDLFDSIKLYTSIIQSSKYIYHGKRLNNISWRIINKSIIDKYKCEKEHKELSNSQNDVSIKKDGVRNIYTIIHKGQDTIPCSKPIIQSNKVHNNNENPEYIRTDLNIMPQSSLRSSSSSSMQLPDSRQPSLFNTNSLIMNNLQM